jgi:hypothetical protein
MNHLVLAGRRTLSELTGELRVLNRLTVVRSAKTGLTQPVGLYIINPSRFVEDLVMKNPFQ